MKRMICMLLLPVLLSGCSALPGEERAFAVALSLSRQGETWEACVRIPTYQSGGGYATLSATGETLGQAMAGLNASAPMELHYGQTRLVIVSRSVAERAGFAQTMAALTERDGLRGQAALAVTEDDPRRIMDVLEPTTGSRLSKSLETMLESRQNLGVIPAATLLDFRRCGERRGIVLAAARLLEEKLQLDGGWMIGSGGVVSGRLSPEEMQLLTLLQGRLKQGTLCLHDGTAAVLDAKCRLGLQGKQVLCRLEMRCVASDMTREGLTQTLEEELRGLIDTLARAGCDALGMGARAMTGCADMAQWRELNWEKIYPALSWQFAINVEKEI